MQVNKSKGISEGNKSLKLQEHLLLRVHSRFSLMRRGRLIGRLLGLLARPPLRRHQCRDWSGLGQRAVDAHSLSV